MDVKIIDYGCRMNSFSPPRKVDVETLAEFECILVHGMSWNDHYMEVVHGN